MCSRLEFLFFAIMTSIILHFFLFFRAWTFGLDLLVQFKVKLNTIVNNYIFPAFWKYANTPFTDLIRQFLCA